MSGTLLELSAASVAFVGIHMAMSSNQIRTPMLARLGRNSFRLVYSVISAVLFTWMITAYIHAPTLDVFEANVPMKHVSLTAMGLACFFIVFGYTTSNPMAVGKQGKGVETQARGVLKITRHPVMWGTALFALCHMLASGHVAALIFFGAIAFLAIAGANHIDNNKRRNEKGDWDDFMQATSFVPLVAIIKGRTRVERGEYKWWQMALTAALYVGLLMSHEPIIGHHIILLPF